MKKVRHHVTRIHPEYSESFDQQFWPVLMAICVVTAIAAGAIVSLLHGTMMWISLLLLPAVALAAIIVLYRLEDSFLRRSLQFAILLSLAIHLVILTLSSLFTIFSITAPEPTAKMIKKPERRIVISNKSRNLVVHQKNKQLTPDNPIETEKIQANPKTQPREVPLVRQEQPEERQISQRRMEQPVVPRKDQQLSQRRANRRQTENRPVSSHGQVAFRSTSKPHTQSKSAVAKPVETNVAKQSASSASQATKSASMKESRSQPTSNLQRRVSKGSATSAKATALSRRETISVPKIANRAKVAPTKRIAEKSPTAKSTKLDVRRETVAQSTASKSKSDPKNSKPREIQQTSARRIASRERNSIKSERTTQTVERTVAARTPTPKSNVQPVRRSVASDANSRNQPQPQAFALTRSSQGTAGAGRSSNLDRVKGGDPSPVQIASDSSHRRQSNQIADNISLSSLQKSSRLDSGRNSDSQRVLKADTVRWANRSGGNRSAAKSIQASAAAVDSSLARERGQVAMEKGSSMLDVGPTKVVTEVTSERRSGGGSPELSDSLEQKSLVTGGRTTNNALRSEGTVELESAQLASADNSQLSRGDGQIADLEARTDSRLAQQTTSRNEVSFEETGSEAVGQPVAMSRRRDGQESLSTSIASDIAHAINEKAGNERGRTAHAPSVNREVKFGGETSSEPVGNVGIGDGNEGVDDLLERADGQPSERGSATSKIANAGPADSSSDSLGSLELQRRNSDSSVGNQHADALANRDHSRQSEAAVSRVSTVEWARAGDSSKDHVISGELEIPEAEPGEIGRQSSTQNLSQAGMMLEINADEGPAGLAELASRRVGTMIDASLESDQLSPQRESRFVQRQSGGSPSVIPNVAVAKEAFRKRNPAALANSGPSTEAAIELGLAFLARNQLADGSWTLGQFDTDDPLYQSQLTSDTAATGLALLAFQGAGYNHREYKYAAQVKAGIEWLIRNQAPDGGLYVEGDKRSNSSCRLYSHAIATLALTEAFGMTQDENVREATQRALDYISNNQDRQYGGWRYYAVRNKRSSDTSVTGWMMMALKSAKLAGLDTQKSTLNGIARWLRVAQSPDSPHEFRYNPNAVDSPGISRAHGRAVSTTMTSVGLLMQVYSGWKPQDPQFIDGAKVLLKQLPSDRNSRLRDTYYWYYATQVMKHAGGDHWDQWRDALHPLLIKSQVKNGEMSGSWHPYKPVPDRWGPQGGRLYVTTMNLLSLEVRYRLLPLYEKTID